MLASPLAFRPTRHASATPKVHHFDDKDICMRNPFRSLIIASLLLPLIGCPDAVVRDSAAALDRE
jgi:hypothetical protein